MLGADFISHGLMFKDEIYHLLRYSSHGSNSQAPFLSHQLISIALHGSSFHPATITYSWFSWAHYSSSKEEDSSRNNHSVWIHRFTCIDSRFYCIEEPKYCFVASKCCKLQQKILQVFNLYFLIHAYLERGGSHEFFPYFLGLLSIIFYHLDCTCVTFGLFSRSHSCPSWDSRGC